MKNKTVKAALGAFTVRKFRNGKLQLFAAHRRAGGVTARELLNTACRIYKLLFPSEKGVASGANADFQIPAGGTGLVDGAASAGNACSFVAGMNIGFHNGKKEG